MNETIVQICAIPCGENGMQASSATLYALTSSGRLLSRDLARGGWYDETPTVQEFLTKTP